MKQIINYVDWIKCISYEGEYFPKSLDSAEGQRHKNTPTSKGVAGVVAAVVITENN